MYCPQSIKYWLELPCVFCHMNIPMSIPHGRDPWMLLIAINNELFATELRLNVEKHNSFMPSETMLMFIKKKYKLSTILTMLCTTNGHYVWIARSLLDKDDEHRKEEERRTMQAEKCKKDIEVKPIPPNYVWILSIYFRIHDDYNKIYKWKL